MFVKGNRCLLYDFDGPKMSLSTNFEGKIIQFGGPLRYLIVRWSFKLPNVCDDVDMKFFSFLIILNPKITFLLSLNLKIDFFPSPSMASYETNVSNRRSQNSFISSATNGEIEPRCTCGSKAVIRAVEKE